MKVRSAVKCICPSCKLVRRGRKQFVICPANARHKQRQGFATLAAALAPRAGAVGLLRAPRIGDAAAELQAMSFDGFGDEDL